MGPQCVKLQQDKNNGIINQMDKILRIDNLSSSDITFWNELKTTNFFIIEKISKTSVEFKNNAIQLENIISFAQVFIYFLTDQNFFFLIPIIEITLSIIDFIEILLKIKEKYNKNFFSLIYFDKLFLMRDEDNVFSRLVYLDDKINEPFNLPEIIINEDKNFFNSITGSMIEGSNMKLVSAIALQKKTNEDTSQQVDFNSYFYSDSKEQYKKLKSTFSYEEFDSFYSNCILYFIQGVLFKKTEVNEQVFSTAFFNLKTRIRLTFKKTFLENQLGPLSLKKIKYILTNFYLNSNEFLIFKSLIDKINPNDYVNAVSNAMQFQINQTDKDEISIKLQEYSQYDIGIIYGNCCYKHPNVSNHSCQFISSKPNNGICLQCVHMVMTEFFSDEQNQNDYFSLQEFEDALVQAYPKLQDNIKDILDYYCCALNSSIKGEMSQINKTKLKIYRKDKQIIFDLNDININSHSSNQFYIEDIINIDYKGKFHNESLKNKKTLLNK